MVILPKVSHAPHLLNLKSFPDFPDLQATRSRFQAIRNRHFIIRRRTSVRSCFQNKVCVFELHLAMPYISLLVGQCGNQLGSATLEEVAANCETDLTRLILPRSLQALW